MPLIETRDHAAVDAQDRKGDPALRPFSPLRPHVVVIGASTGGPQAIAAVAEGLGLIIEAISVVVVLHMPASFTASVAAQTQKLTGISCRPASNGEAMHRGTLYFAPGDAHLRIARIGARLALCHFDGPPENYCKPAVDVLFRSAALALGPRALGVVLTGMGYDGLVGARAIVEAGGSVIVQDEASSAVWGMPGAVAAEGLASAILPADRIGAMIGRLVKPTKEQRAWK